MLTRLARTLDAWHDLLTECAGLIRDARSHLPALMRTFVARNRFGDPTYACPDREALAVLEGTPALNIRCPKHAIRSGSPCPMDDDAGDVAPEQAPIDLAARRSQIAELRKDPWEGACDDRVGAAFDAKVKDALTIPCKAHDVPAGERCPDADELSLMPGAIGFPASEPEQAA